MPPRHSVLIAVYKHEDYLNLILAALAEQTYSDFEVIICEDDESKGISDCVAHWQNHSSLRIQHVHQADSGFRKTKILNEGIRASKGEYLIFIDGDCIPHPKFIQSYQEVAKRGVAMHGRRVMLSDILSKQLLTYKKSFPPSLLDLFISRSKKIENSFRMPWLRKKSKASAIWGCNWGIAREHLLELNGFDEDYVKAGVGEDVDIEWRILKCGITLLDVKHLAIIYHLHHRQGYSDSDVAMNYALMAQKQNLGLIACINGLLKP